MPINVKCKREKLGSNALEARNDTKLIREEKGQLKKSMANKTKDNKMKFINCAVRVSNQQLLVHYHYGNDNTVNNTVRKNHVQ